MGGEEKCGWIRERKSLLPETSSGCYGSRALACSRLVESARDHGIPVELFAEAEQLHHHHNLLRSQRTGEDAHRCSPPAAGNCPQTPPCHVPSCCDPYLHCKCTPRAASDSSGEVLDVSKYFKYSLVSSWGSEASRAEQQSSGRRAQEREGERCAGRSRLG